jgi:hypothetical protein
MTVVQRLQYYSTVYGVTGFPDLSVLSPAAMKVEQVVSLTFQYQSPVPTMRPDFFAGLMDFWLRVEQSGEYTFKLDADDRAWLWVDGWQKDVSEGASSTLSGLCFPRFYLHQAVLCHQAVEEVY